MDPRQIIIQHIITPQTPLLIKQSTQVSHVYQNKYGKPKVPPPQRRGVKIDVIVQGISNHANELIAKWGQENAPPPPYIYSLKNTPNSPMGGLHVIQKIFQGDFEFDILYNSKSSTEKITRNPP
jgi:hypothetical protein